MKSTMIMLSPLCESHSRQAASHARQPMQRDGSMNIVLIAKKSTSFQRALPSFSGGALVSPTVYGNILGAFSGVRLTRGPSAPGDGGASSRSTVAAHALYSGILTVGSTAGLVSWFTDCLWP